MPVLGNRAITKGKLPKIVLLLLALFLMGVVFSISLLTWYSSLSALEDTSRERLVLYQGTLRSALDKYRYLPYFLSRDESVLQLFSDLTDPELVNCMLEDANQKAGSAALFIMDEKGKTISASNWNSNTSYIGQNYGFRPYFQDAMNGKEGGFYAIGVTTGTPGYFMSHPIYRTGKIKGVVVVKVDLSGLQKDWMDGGEIVFVSDGNGVIFLSSRIPWKYKSLVPLTPETITKIRMGKQYKGITLKALPIKTGSSGDKKWVIINGEKFFWADILLTNFNWHLNYLLPWRLIEEPVRSTFYISSAIGILLILGILYVQERQQKNISQQRAIEAERIGRMNQKLQNEVEERRRTEAHLRHTQDELVQSAKLAALGQMAAAIVHELNQPIAAVRTYAASCRLMLDRNREEELKQTLFSISGITDRMEAITRQLKNFARKSPLSMKDLDIKEPIQKALDLLRYAISDAECSINIEMPTSPLYVQGDGLRLEQVFINLIKNGLDSMAAQEEKAIHICVSSDKDHVMVHISDIGPGIEPDFLKKVFNPFFTTKQKGDGLGLGLSISQGIVKEMAGKIQAKNQENQGALFTVRLRKGKT